MKVELDLSSEQLAELDKGLVDLINSLTDEQRIEIVKSYINYQFGKFYETYKDYYGQDKERLSKFGKDLVDGLQDQIKKSVTADIMNDENLKKLIQDEIDTTIKNLPVIIDKAISSYVVDHLFSDKSYIENRIMNGIHEAKARGYC